MTCKLQIDVDKTQELEEEQMKKDLKKVVEEGRKHVLKAKMGDKMREELVKQTGDPTRGQNTAGEQLDPNQLAKDLAEKLCLKLQQPEKQKCIKKKMASMTPKNPMPTAPNPAIPAGAFTKPSTSVR